MASKVAAPKFTELIYGEACHIAHRVELGAHLTGSHSACENLGRTSAQRRRKLNGGRIPPVDVNQRRDSVLGALADRSQWLARPPTDWQAEGSASKCPVVS